MSLSQFRVEGEPEIFVPSPVICRENTAIVLSVDQTLNASGWALMYWSEGLRRIKVDSVGMIGVDTDLTSHEGSLDQADKIFIEFQNLISRLNPSLVVHEYPAVSRPGLKISRPESSLLAASSLRLAAMTRGVRVAPPVPAQKTKTRFTGDSKATKADIKKAVELLDPSTKDMRPMNENVRDAIANGWLAMERES